jgi:hypothetical protein
LQYNLLTQYTSFVAIDSEVRNKEGESTTVKQPLPLPEGVSDLAVGAPAQMSLAAPRGLAQSFRATPSVEEKTKAGKWFPTKDQAGTTGKRSEPQPVPTVVPETKTVGIKTFSLTNGIWVDSAHTTEKEIIKIKRDSQAYKDLLAAKPELKQYFELGAKVIVNLGKYSIEIAEDGKTELTKEELQKLIQS